MLIHAFLRNNIFS